MSNWMITDGVLRIWDYDCNDAELKVKPCNDGFILYMTGPSSNDMGAEDVTIHLGLFNRHLEILRDFINGS